MLMVLLLSSVRLHRYITQVLQILDTSSLYTDYRMPPKKKKLKKKTETFLTNYVVKPKVHDEVKYLIHSK